MRTGPGNGATTPEPAAPAPSRRQYAYGLGFIGFALAGIVAVPALLLGAANTCGCTTPADMAIYNAASHPVTVRWQQPGLLGTPLFGASGSQELAACTSSELVLPVGANTVTVSSSSDSEELAVDVPVGHGGYDIPKVVVRSGGTVEQLDVPLPETEIPTEGRCGT